MSSGIQRSVYPDYEETAKKWNISSAVRISPNYSIIECGGQTGGIDWKFGTLEEQVEIIFAKLDKSLCAAVPEMTSEEVWKHVYFMNTYVVGWKAEQGQIFSNITKKYMGDTRLAATSVGVESLAYPGCLVEIEIKAAVPN